MLVILTWKHKVKKEETTNWSRTHPHHQLTFSCRAVFMCMLLCNKHNVVYMEGTMLVQIAFIPVHHLNNLFIVPIYVMLLIYVTLCSDKYWHPSHYVNCMLCYMAVWLCAQKKHVPGHSAGSVLNKGATHLNREAMHYLYTCDAMPSVYFNIYAPANPDLGSTIAYSFPAFPHNVFYRQDYSGETYQCVSLEFLITCCPPSPWLNWTLKHSTYSGISPIALLQLLCNSERQQWEAQITNEKCLPAQIKCDLKVIVAVASYV